ncbi:MAG: serine/threonine-protein phosphatase, partial [Bacteroidales bacterium]|nr:serine/threonine-protein phosphatase [Bacteroidales bacterium]
MKEMKFYGATDMGRLRTNNEDAFVAQHIWSNRYVLCIAIDGVGGYEGGEVAAQIAQEYIPRHLAELLPDNPLEALKEAVVEANNRIFEARQHDSSRPNMGCVLSAGIIELDNNIIDVVHVGDSRIYRYQGIAFDKITHDHSLVGYREEIGELTEEEAMNHPQRNIIDRLLGDAPHTTTERGFFEAGKYPLEENTQLLFCSDGLTDLVTRAEMMDILDQHISIEEKTRLLIDKANEKGGKDNITVVLAIAENKYAQPKETVVEAPKQKPLQPTTNDKNHDNGSKKSRKALWIFFVAALLIAAAAFVTGNILADKGVVSVTCHENPVDYTDSVTTLNNTIDSLQNILNNTATDSVNAPKDEKTGNQ